VAGRSIEVPGESDKRSLYDTVDGVLGKAKYTNQFWMSFSSLIIFYILSGICMLSLE